MNVVVWLLLALLAAALVCFVVGVTMAAIHWRRARQYEERAREAWGRR